MKEDAVTHARGWELERVFRARPEGSEPRPVYKFSRSPTGVRVTRFGLVLRSTSTDELQTLLKVRKGEVSLAGPRPVLTEYLPLYSAEQDAPRPPHASAQPPSSSHFRFQAIAFRPIT